jgi:hypothetical protein
MWQVQTLARTKLQGAVNLEKAACLLREAIYHGAA